MGEEIVRNEHDVDEDGSLKPTELSAFEYRQQGRREMGRYPCLWVSP